MTPDPSSTIRVIHSVDNWLGRTLAWLHSQVASLPATVENHVLCEATENLGEFPVARLNCYGSSEAAMLRWLAARSWRYRLLRKRTLMRAIGRGATGSPVIVHSHFGTRGWFDIGDVCAIGARHVVSFYGYDLDRMPRQDPAWCDRYRALFAHADRVLCEGPRMLERVAALGCPSSKLRLHRLGVDVASIPFRPRSKEDGEPLRVLIASSFFEKKGIPYAIEALAEVRRRIPVAVTIAGDAMPQESSQREKRRIIETLARCGMSDAVSLRGFVSQPQLLELAYAHHVFVAPSVTAADGDTEGGAPMVLPLLAATGMPIVSTRHRDIPEVVLDGVCGSLADERDVAGLAAGIEACVANFPCWPDRAAHARDHIERRFNTALQGPRLAAIYRELASEAVHRAPAVGRQSADTTSSNDRASAAVDAPTDQAQPSRTTTIG
jgi:colanic acid/amylovoran biosynthesis glycosyltransferase